MKRIFIYLAVILASVTVIAVADSRNKVDSFIEANIDALTQYETDDCISRGGNINMATVCAEAALVNATCNISGEITVLVVTLKGSYTKGNAYVIPWARYTCTNSTGNCCIKQGLYSGDMKLA